MAIMTARDSILVPEGTIKILHTKQSLGLSQHTINAWNFWNPNARCETLHKQSMGKDFYLAWYFSDQELVATIKWRHLSENEKEQISMRETMDSYIKNKALFSNSTSLREVSDHTADAVAFSQLSKRGK